MASSSFSVSTARNTTNITAVDVPGHTRSTHHGRSSNNSNPPPLGAGRKRSYGGSESDPGRGGLSAAATDREPERPGSAGFSGGTGHGSLSSATSAQQQAKEDGGPGSPGVDTPNSTDANPSAKKPKTSRGSRGVAHLTREQLERKRANDREAQRAIRERQRLRTEQYERQIAELKSTQPYQELQKVLRQKEAAEAELADVKRSLAAVVAIIHPILGTVPGVVDPSCPSPNQSRPLTQPLPALTARNPASTPTSAASPVSVGTHGRWQNSLSPVAHTVSIDGQQSQTSPEMGLLHQQRYDLAHSLDLGPDRLGLDFLVDPSLKVAKIQNGVHGAQDSPSYRHVPMKHDWTAAISMMPGMQPDQTQSQTQSPIYTQPPVASGLPSSSTTTTTAGPPITNPPSVYALVPRNCPPTCPLDSLLLDFLFERRQRAADGLSQSEILGPRYPSVSSLLNPAVSAYSHPLSKVFTDILARFPDLHTLPERVGVLYLMFLLMRWQVSPTEENYLRLPAWFRPLRCQTDKDHPAWYDHLIFPRMRERLVATYEPGGFPFDDFFIPFTTTLSVNWPYEDAYVLLASPTGEELMINPVFEQHMGVLENWTLGEAFERAFPSLAGCYNLRREKLNKV